MYVVRANKQLLTNNLKKYSGPLFLQFCKLKCICNYKSWFYNWSVVICCFSVLFLYLIRKQIFWLLFVLYNLFSFDCRIVPFIKYAVFMIPINILIAKLALKEQNWYTVKLGYITITVITNTRLLHCEHIELVGLV